ncbi:MAG: hypothetical protein IJH37_07090 [Clostridia bacterium]|nr:hypothetical protein [Clostridia bacterium]
MKNLKIMSAAMAAMMTISALSISVLADELDTAVIPADSTISVETPAAELPKEEQPVIDAVVNDTEVTLNEKADTVTLFTGGAITPDVVLYSNGTRLVLGTDYTLDYADNVNVGTATITVTFIGNYTGTRTLHFNIVARELGQNDIVISDISSDPYTYTGSAVTPKPTVSTTEGTTLTENVDYTLTYTDNTDVGTATITVTFKGNYSGEAETTFTIGSQQLDMDGVNISAIADQIYTGSPITPEPSVRYGSLVLIKDRDYELGYANNVAVGVATITITLKNNYSGTKDTTFNIVAKAIDTGNIQIGDPQPGDTENGVIRVAAIEAQTYSGSAITPQPTVKFGSTTLVEGVDFDFDYANNINAGTATLSITLKGNYSGSGNIDFAINPKTVTDSNVTIGAILDQIFTGSAITPEPEVTDLER